MNVEISETANGWVVRRGYDIRIDCRDSTAECHVFNDFYKMMEHLRSISALLKEEK